MRTNIDIDDSLMDQALEASGLPTKRAAVEEGLRLLLKRHQRQGILALKGKIAWEGDLGESRLGRGFAAASAEFTPADPAPEDGGG